MKIVIEIVLGNELMVTNLDVVKAVDASLSQLVLENEESVEVDLHVGTGRIIKDKNGNSVGKWKVVP